MSNLRLQVYARALVAEMDLMPRPSAPINARYQSRSNNLMEQAKAAPSRISSRFTALIAALDAAVLAWSKQVFFGGSQRGDNSKPSASANQSREQSGPSISSANNPCPASS